MSEAHKNTHQLKSQGWVGYFLMSIIQEEIFIYYKYDKVKSLPMNTLQSSKYIYKYKLSK